MSAFGCVVRTVLTSGSSTGLTPPVRVAPSRASRRRTAAAPDAPSVGAGTAAAPSAGGLDRRVTRLAADRAADFLLPPLRPAPFQPGGAAVAASAEWSAVTGSDAGAVCSCSSTSSGMGAAGVTPTSAAGRSWVTSGPAVLAVATSPATCAPHVRRGIKSIGGRFGKCRAPYVASHGEQSAYVQTG